MKNQMQLMMAKAQLALSMAQGLEVVQRMPGPEKLKSPRSAVQRSPMETLVQSALPMYRR